MLLSSHNLTDSFECTVILVEQNFRKQCDNITRLQLCGVKEVTLNTRPCTLRSLTPGGIPCTQDPMSQALKCTVAWMFPSPPSFPGRSGASLSAAAAAGEVRAMYRHCRSAVAAPTEGNLSETVRRSATLPTVGLLGNHANSHWTMKAPGCNRQTRNIQRDNIYESSIL